MSTRAIAPVIGVVLVVVITMVLAGGVLLFAPHDISSPPLQVQLAGTVDAETNELTIEHRRGDPLHVDRIDLQVWIDGEPLRHQPPGKGFRNMPTGPLNPSTDSEWAAGESTTLALASTNEPLPRSDSRVVVRVVLDGTTISETELVHA